MKCNQAEKYILLRDSSELSGKLIRQLDAHVDHCASCCRFVELLEEATGIIDIAEEPSAKSVENVLRAARVNAPVKKHRSIFGYKPALASLASVVLLLGVLMGNLNNNRIGMEMVLSEAQLLEPEDQVVSIMYDGLSEDDLAFNFLMTYEENQEG